MHTGTAAAAAVLACPALGRIFASLPYGAWVRLASAQRMGLLIHEANRDLAYLGQLAAEGKLRAVVERQYPLSEVPEAMRRMCDGEIVGKAVIVVD